MKRTLRSIPRLHLTALKSGIGLSVTLTPLFSFPVAVDPAVDVVTVGVVNWLFASSHSRHAVDVANNVPVTVSWVPIVL
jgi:hypothetical protein